ncbi:unnamed protein product [Enterobius vermicularis]|uniref:Tartrate-resistant acid phosphatase type 5 n=1 Tax=Enterobius vermicularis TaxID=51028 RepID=A0A0N4VGT8_ENTVE|nr:unnamed protein product [Enterobius vermicularis]
MSSHTYRDKQFLDFPFSKFYGQADFDEIKKFFWYTGLPVYPYYTYTQTKVAKAMANLDDGNMTQFVLTTGDNIYYTGVDGVDDKRFQVTYSYSHVKAEMSGTWKKTFENVYRSPGLDKPWYFVAGNHDHFGNITAQIMYTYKSDKWTFPAPFYTISYEFGPQKTRVDIIAIDTINLCGNTVDLEHAGFFGFFKMLFSKTNTDPHQPKNVTLAEHYLQWIEHQLNSSKADYLFVVGHYPIYSASSHGSSSCLIKKLNPLLQKYNVTSYFSGHDHNLQASFFLFQLQHFTSRILLHILLGNKENSGNGTKCQIHYVVSGAGSRSDSSMKNKHQLPDTASLLAKGVLPFSQLGFAKGGFVVVRLYRNRGFFDFYEGNGALQRSFRVNRRYKPN